MKENLRLLGDVVFYTAAWLVYTLGQILWVLMMMAMLYAILFTAIWVFGYVVYGR